MSSRFRFDDDLQGYDGWVQEGERLSSFQTVCSAMEEMEQALHMVVNDPIVIDQPFPDPFVEHLKKSHGQAKAIINEAHYKSPDGVDKFWKTVREFKQNHEHILRRRGRS